MRLDTPRMQENLAHKYLCKFHVLPSAPSLSQCIPHASPPCCAHVQELEERYSSYRRFLQAKLDEGCRSTQGELRMSFLRYGVGISSIFLFTLSPHLSIQSFSLRLIVPHHLFSLVCCGEGDGTQMGSDNYCLLFLLCLVSMYPELRSSQALFCCYVLK